MVQRRTRIVFRDAHRQLTHRWDLAGEAIQRTTGSHARPLIGMHDRASVSSVGLRRPGLIALFCTPEFRDAEIPAAVPIGGPARTRGESPESRDGMPCTVAEGHGTMGHMNIEVAVPDDWTPGQAMAVRQLLQHALRNAQPVIALIRKDATAEQLQDIYRRIGEVIREADLEVERAPAPSS